MIKSKAITNRIGPSIIRNVPIFNGFLSFIENRDMIIEIIAIGGKAIVRA